MMNESKLKFKGHKWSFYVVVIAALLTVVITYQFYQLSKDFVTGAVVVETPNGVVNIVEFSDFECPFCRRAAPLVDQVLKTYGDAVQFEYKHFPLAIHANAQKAAEASECARDQGKFKNYHDILFAHQEDLSIIQLKQYAKELGLNEERFSHCIDSGNKKSLVRADFKEGRSLGVTGTPTFFIGDKKLVGVQPFSEFKAVIDAELGE